MNFYEITLRKALQSDFECDHLREIGESLPFFNKLMSIYPTHGSKIDWAQVPHSIENIEKQENLQITKFVAFFDEIITKFELFGDIVYIGDSATDFALEGSLNSMRKVLTDLLDIPQHHYFIGLGYSWCMCFTMEGNMGFGFAPKALSVRSLST